MAVQDVQAGFGYVHGIAGSATFTNLAASDLWSAGAKSNIESISKTHNWTDEEITSQDGTIIEAVIASKEFRDIRCKFMPKADTRANAESVIDTFTALAPNEVITLGAFTVSEMNGTYNFKGGLTTDLTREGRVTLEFNLRQYKNASGAFAGLAKITG